MEENSIKPLNEDQYGPIWCSCADLELLIAPEWCIVRSIMEADIEDYTANLLWQPRYRWLLKEQSIIQKRAEGTLLL